MCFISHTLFALSASAQPLCGGFTPGLFQPGISPVFCSTVWDPDGAGPQPEQLIVGGEFNRAGGVTGINATHIAAYNGAWSPMDSGIDGSVRALTVFRGKLIAAGAFFHAGPGVAFDIASWDGTQWTPLINPDGSDDSDRVIKAVAVFSDRLYIAGRINSVRQRGSGATLPLHNIAMWDGTTWSSVGSGIDGEVNALAVHNGRLYAGGSFSAAGGTPAARIASWDGLQWRALGGGVNDDVRSLASYNGELYAGGYFDVAGEAVAHGVARWNGTLWRNLTAEFRGYPSALAVYNGELIVGGAGYDNTNDYNGIARWNGTQFRRLAASGNDLGGGQYNSATVDGLSVYNGQLAVSGYFTRAGGNTVESLAFWNGTSWLDVPGVLPFALTGTANVSAFAQWDGKLVLAGTFESRAQADVYAVSNLATWDGLKLGSFGRASPNGNVHAMVTHLASPIAAGSDLYIAGAFTQLDIYPTPIAATRVAVWQSSTVPFGWRTLGSGFDNTVYALEFYNGSLYAGGDFVQSGTNAVSHVSRWTGTAWVPVGAGFNGTVRCLKAFGTFLYAGGDFTATGATTANGLARYDGANWAAVSTAISGSVRAMTIHNGFLAVGGLFTHINSPNIHWFSTGTLNGTYGTGGTNGMVTSLASNGGRLYLGGFFTTAGGVQARGLASVATSDWREFGGGAVGAVNALQAYHSEVEVGGTFNFVDNASLESPLWARYLINSAPWIADQPESVAACGHSIASMRAQVAVGFTPFSPTYRWSRAGVPLNDGSTGTGSTIIGSTASTLTISNVTPADAGSYTCTVADFCGSETSVEAVLSILCYNIANVAGLGGTRGCDDQLTADDLLLFLDRFFANDATIADLVGLGGVSGPDGQLTPDDLVAFLSAFFAGCPS